MVKVKCYYDKEKVIKITKSTQIKSLILSIILTIVMLVLGIMNLVSSLGKEKTDYLGLVLSIIIILLSIVPLISSIKNFKTSGLDAIKEMGLENSSISIEFLFKEKRIEVLTTRNDETKLKTVMIKNIHLVKVDNKGISIYLNQDDMFYIYNEEIVEGNKQQLISIFVKNGIKVK